IHAPSSPSVQGWEAPARNSNGCRNVSPQFRKTSHTRCLVSSASTCLSFMGRRSKTRSDGSCRRLWLSRVTSLPSSGSANHPSSIVVCQPKSLHIMHQHPRYHLFLKIRFRHRSPHCVPWLCSQLRNFIPCFTT